jgi:DNA-binding beta-propeller fold protein YncE
MMGLQFLHFIDLPENIEQGGFDHAAVHHTSNRIYVAHTSNNAIDVIDCAKDRFLFSIPNLKGVAGALVSEERGLVFTSNRGEDTVGIFKVGDEQNIAKVKVGMRPNGLSFDMKYGLLLAANVGNPDITGSFTLSIVDVEQRKIIANIPIAGRTRWTIFDVQTNAFYINVSDPAQIVVVDSAHPDRIMRTLAIPAAGPHGLDLDATTGRLFCACDDRKLVTVEAASGKILGVSELSGKPDVIFFNLALRHLYVAVGDPGVIDVFDTQTMSHLETISTEKGAHTLAFDAVRNKVHAFLPGTHRAQVFTDA